MDRVPGGAVAASAAFAGPSHRTTSGVGLARAGLDVEELVHDLRQELAVVRHLVDGLTASPSTGPGSEQLLAGLAAQVEALDDLVLSAVVPPRRERVDVGEVARAVVGAARLVHDGEVRLPATPAAPVLADAVLLRRALLNLVVNACEARPGGAVVVRVLVDDRAVRVEVQDDGPAGSAPDDDAVGLGLWVVHAVVRDAGGTVTRRTGPDGGRVVVVRLPSVQEGSR